MMIFRSARAPSLFAILLLGGCTGPSIAGPGSIAGSGQMAAGFGQRLYVDGPHVTPLKLIEDSRCPSDVDCVWAGRVRLLIRIETGRGAVEREIASNEALPVADGTLRLAAIHPDRVSRTVIPPAEYRFSFRFDGGL